MFLFLKSSIWTFKQGSKLCLWINEKLNICFPLISLERTPLLYTHLCLLQYKAIMHQMEGTCFIIIV